MELLNYNPIIYMQAKYFDVGIPEQNLTDLVFWQHHDFDFYYLVIGNHGLTMTFKDLAFWQP